MEVGWVIYHKGSGLIGLIKSFQSQSKLFLSSKKDSAYSPGMHPKGEFLGHSKKLVLRYLSNKEASYISKQSRA